MDRKHLANKVLAGFFFVFVLVSVLKYFYKESLVIQLVSFMAEAAVVGGVADWFAVTALFKKPLGFPWHTAVITRHRERVITAMADMIEYELLSVQSIKQRVDKISFVSLLIDWVENKNGKLLLKKLFNKHSGKILASIDVEVVSQYLDGMLKTKVSAITLTPHIKRATMWAVEHNQYEQMVSCIVDECINMVQKNETKQWIYRELLKIRERQVKSIFEKAVFWLAEQTDSINLSEVSEIVYEEILAILYEAKNTDHILYKWLHTKLLEMSNQLESSDSWSEVIEDWKQSVAKEMDVTQVIEEFAQSALKSVQDSSDSPIFKWFYEQIQNYWDNFTQNLQTQIWLEVSIKQAVYRLIENEHQLIGTIVKSVFNTFSDDDLNQFIEDKAGDDLQWIRINGCVVGGVVGLGIFTFLHFIYDPYAVPLIQGIFR